MQGIITFLRIGLGLLLIVAGALKMGHAPDLASAIAGFRLLPEGVVEPLALILPYFEALLGLYLVAGLFTRGAAVVTCAQFVIYAGAIASAVVRHIPANCGCFGPYDRSSADWPHVAFDLVLAGIAALVAKGAPGLLALDRRMARG
jgi:putative oxidoreductase